MNGEELNLDNFRNYLKLALAAYAGELGDKKLRFEDFPDFQLTPDKTNTARTVVPVTYDEKEAGDLYAIVFTSGDGTGSSSEKYNLGNVNIPSEFRYDEKQDRVIPRSKAGVIAEMFFPFFSISTDAQEFFVPFATCLEELTLDKANNIIQLCHLGQDPETYLGAMNSPLSLAPQAQLTVGNYQRKEDEDPKRIGDPHAVHYGGGKNYDRLAQVGGFLAIKDKYNPLMRLIESGNIGFRGLIQKT